MATLVLLVKLNCIASQIDNFFDEGSIKVLALVRVVTKRLLDRRVIFYENTEQRVTFTSEKVPNCI